MTEMERRIAQIRDQVRELKSLVEYDPVERPGRFNEWCEIWEVTFKLYEELTTSVSGVSFEYRYPRNPRRYARKELRSCAEGRDVKVEVKMGTSKRYLIPANVNVDTDNNFEVLFLESDFLTSRKRLLGLLSKVVGALSSVAESRYDPIPDPPALRWHLGLLKGQPIVGWFGKKLRSDLVDRCEFLRNDPEVDDRGRTRLRKFEAFRAEYKRDSEGHLEEVKRLYRRVAADSKIVVEAHTPKVPKTKRANQSKELSNLEKRVLRLIDECGPITEKDLNLKLKMDPKKSTVRNAALRLKKTHDVKNDNDGRGYYRRSSQSPPLKNN